MKRKASKQTTEKPNGFSRTLNFLVMFFRDRINCLRGKHKWERRMIHFQLYGNPMGSTVGWGCSVCGEHSLKDPIQEKHNATSETEEANEGE